jgi:hypothetical protein
MGKESDRDEKHLTAQRGAGGINKCWRLPTGQGARTPGMELCLCNSAADTRARMHALPRQSFGARRIQSELPARARAARSPAGPARLIICRYDLCVGEARRAEALLYHRQVAVYRDASRSRGSAAAHVGGPAGGTSQPRATYSHSLRFVDVFSSSVT